MTNLDQTAPSVDMFQAPVNRAMKILDRSFFRKDINLAAACILDVKKITRYQKELSTDILEIPRLRAVRSVPVDTLPNGNARGVLLKPEVRINGKQGQSQRSKSVVLIGLDR